jgi:hypothetical protein
VKRRRAYILLPILAGIALLSRLYGNAPTEVDVTYRLGSMDARSLALRYVRPSDGALVRQAQLTFDTPPATPGERTHRARLGTGKYQVHIVATDAAGRVREADRTLEIVRGADHVYVDF